MKKVEQSKQKIYQPSWKQYWHWFRGRSIGAMILMLGFVALIFNQYILIALPIVILLTPLMLLLIKVRLKYVPTRIIIGDELITYRTLFRTKYLRRDERMEGFLCVYVATANPFPINLLAMKNSNARARIRLNGGYWSADDLVAIAEAAGIKIYPPTDVLTTVMLVKKYPKLMYYAEVHPIWLSLIISTVCLIVSVVAAILIVGSANI